MHVCEFAVRSWAWLILLLVCSLFLRELFKWWETLGLIIYLQILYSFFICFLYALVFLNHIFFFTLSNLSFLKLFLDFESYLRKAFPTTRLYKNSSMLSPNICSTAKQLSQHCFLKIIHPFFTALT